MDTLNVPKSSKTKGSQLPKFAPNKEVRETADLVAKDYHA